MFTAMVNATTGRMEWEKMGNDEEDDDDYDVSGDLARYSALVHTTIIEALRKYTEFSCLELA